jgi:protein-tyrosine phosphatase
LVGCVVLRFFGRDRCIRGGPFDDFCPPDIGVCLEALSARADRASIALPVADYRAPSPAALADGLLALLLAMRAVPERAVYIGCRAGLGRTGMLIAALAKLAGQGDPVDWTRRHYHPRAVETAAQEKAVATLDAGAIWRRVEEAA